MNSFSGLAFVFGGRCKTPENDSEAEACFYFTKSMSRYLGRGQR